MSTNGPRSTKPRRFFDVPEIDTVCAHPRCEIVLPAGVEAIRAKMRGTLYCSHACRERHTRTLIQTARRENVPTQKSYERENKLIKKYGLTLQQWDDLYDHQLGRCALCLISFGEKQPHVDHNHETGAVRGLLCSQCNTALGLLKDDTAVMQRAIDYILSDGIEV